jgi:Flp pilus assembly protein TadG
VGILPKRADLAPRNGSRLARTVADPNDAGAAAVEFALVVPILLALVFGIVNFGFIFSSQISMNAAARDAARAGVVKGATGALTCQQIASRARDAVVLLGASVSSVAVAVTKYDGSTMCTLPVGSASATPTGSAGAGGTPCTASSAPADAVTVTLSYAYRALVPLVPPQQATLGSTAKFRCEYVT